MGGVGIHAKIFLCLNFEKRSPFPPPCIMGRFPIIPIHQIRDRHSLHGPFPVSSTRQPLPPPSSSPHSAQQELIHIQVSS